MMTIIMIDLNELESVFTDIEMYRCSVEIDRENSKIKIKGETTTGEIIDDEVSFN